MKSVPKSRGRRKKQDVPTNPARGNRGAASRGKPDRFPSGLFKQLLQRYVRENFTREDVKKHAMCGTPYIGVCIGDDNGSVNCPIIDGVMAAGTLSEIDDEDEEVPADVGDEQRESESPPPPVMPAVDAAAARPQAERYVLVTDEHGNIACTVPLGVAIALKDAESTARIVEQLRAAASAEEVSGPAHAAEDACNELLNQQCLQLGEALVMLANAANAKGGR